MFIISSGPYSIVADNTIRRETERIRGGRLLEDGRIVFDYDAAAFWSLGEGAVWDSFVTIDGDFMKTLDFPEMIDEWTEEQIQDYSNDWFRVDCTSQ